MTRPHLILNAGKPKDLALAHAARRSGARVVSAEDVGAAVADAVARGVERIVVGGGDGTVHWAAGRVLDLEAAASVALGIVPLGTANDLARGLGLPLVPEEALALALDGSPAPIDVGRAAEGWFVNAYSIGLGAEATRRADPDVKRVLGAFAYVLSGVASAFDHAATALRITTADGVREHRVLLASICNTGHVGGFRIVPDASPDDGRLDLVAIVDLEPDDPSTVVALLDEIRRGEGENGRHLLRLRGEWFEFERLESGDAWSNLDGESRPQPARTRIEVATKRLRVVRPAA